MAVKKNVVKTTLANSYATFKALLDSIGGAKKTITVAADINIDTSFTFPSNIDLDFINQSKLIIGAGVVITNGINLGGRDYSHQIIECAVADTPTLVGCQFVRPEWFGGGKDIDNSSAVNKCAKCRIVKIKYYSGTYNFESIVDLPYKTELIGSGKDSTILYATSGAYHLFIGHDSLCVKDMTIQRPPIARNTSYKAINFDAAQYIIEDNTEILIENVVIKDFDIGLYATGGSSKLIKKVKANNCDVYINSLGTGGGNSVRPTINLSSIDMVEIINCKLDTQNIAAAVNNVYIFAIKKLYIHGNILLGGEGVKVLSNPTYDLEKLEVCNNKFNDNYIGVLVQTETKKVKDVLISGNIFQDTHEVEAEGTILFSNLSGNVISGVCIESAKIIGNTFLNCPRNPVLIQMSAGNTFGDLILSDNRYYSWGSAIPGAYKCVDTGSLGAYNTIITNNEICDGNGIGRSYSNGGNFINKNIGAILEVNCTNSTDNESLRTKLNTLQVKTLRFTDDTINGINYDVAFSKYFTIWENDAIPNEHLISINSYYLGGSKYRESEPDGATEISMNRGTFKVNLAAAGTKDSAISWLHLFQILQTRTESNKPLHITDTTEAESPDFGAIQTQGGIYAAKKIRGATGYFGGSTNYTEIESDGTIVLNGSATAFGDIDVDLTPLQSGGTAPGFVSIASTGIRCRSFAVGEDVDGCKEIPHEYKLASTITPHIHFTLDSAPTGTDYVKFRLTATIINADGTVSTATTYDTADIAVDTQWKRYDANFATFSNSVLGGQILFKIARIAASGDAYAGECPVYTFGFHVEKDGFGSRQITTK